MSELPESADVGGVMPDEVDDDVALMLAFKRGDYNAFAVLVDRHQRPLVRFFFGFVGDRQRAEDAAQEVWRKIFRARRDYEPRARFTTFLYRVARNHWIDTCRAASKRGTEYSLDRPLKGEDGPGAGAFVPSGEETPLEAMENLELKEAIEVALSQLPDGQREVFAMAEFQGLKYAEISEILEIPVGTVKSRMFNAVRRLRELLKAVS
ncbi:MAG: sigma-70 family RNA polymerase sigma factor [Planctomycetota bacterium]